MGNAEWVSRTVDSTPKSEERDLQDDIIVWEHLSSKKTSDSMGCNVTFDILFKDMSTLI